MRRIGGCSETCQSRSLATASTLLVPQWQGSGHARARELADGAERLARLAGEATSPAGHWPTDRTARRFGVDSYDAPVAVRAAVSGALTDGPVLTIGGDCGADLEPITWQLRRRDGDLAVVWLDAHVDPGETEWLAADGITPFGFGVFDDPWSLVEALLASGRSAVHIHVDLDVLDPAVFPWTGYPEPSGPDVAGVVRVVEAVAATLPVSSAFVGEHMGGDEIATAAAAPIVAALKAAVAPIVP